LLIIGIVSACVKLIRINHPWQNLCIFCSFLTNYSLVSFFMFFFFNFLFFNGLVESTVELIEWKDLSLE